MVLTQNEKDSNAYMMEGIGSFIFVLVIQLAHDAPYASFAIPASLFIAIFLTANITGGSHNGGITLLCYLNNSARNKNESGEKYQSFVVSQVLGGTIAGLLTAYFRGPAELARLDFHSLSIPQAFTQEFLYCLPILLVICLIADDKAYGFLSPAFKGVLVAATVFIAGSAIGNGSGGCINPSVAASLALARIIATGSVEEFAVVWVYILAPIAAAFATSSIYQNVMRPNIVDEEEERAEDDAKYIQLKDIKTSK